MKKLVFLLIVSGFFFMFFLSLAYVAAPTVCCCYRPNWEPCGTGCSWKSACNYPERDCPNSYCEVTTTTTTTLPPCDYDECVDCTNNGCEWCFPTKKCFEDCIAYVPPWGSGNCALGPCITDPSLCPTVTTTTTLPGGEVTITIYEGTNIVGISGLTEADFSDCGLVYYQSASKPGCLYDDNGYFVYYDPLGEGGGDCDSNFFSASAMEDGFGYYLYAGQECEITFDIPTEVEVTLYPETNMISVPAETNLDDIAEVCGDKNVIFTNYTSASKSGCLYDDNGYFVYYDPLGEGGGDCDSNFFSDDTLRPFVGYYVYFNGNDGDGVTSCTLAYENGEFVHP